jgi:hypothetical protein
MEKHGLMHYGKAYYGALLLQSIVWCTMEKHNVVHHKHSVVQYGKG